jgi:hypothetical protein
MMPLGAARDPAGERARGDDDSSPRLASASFCHFRKDRHQ